jgi:hypothetical protein
MVHTRTSEDAILDIPEGSVGRGRGQVPCGFALVVFCVQVRNCFPLPAMPMRVVSGKSKLMRDGLRTGILGLRVSMDGILF